MSQLAHRTTASQDCTCLTESQYPMRASDWRLKELTRFRTPTSIHCTRWAAYYTWGCHSFLNSLESTRYAKNKLCCRNEGSINLEPKKSPNSTQKAYLTNTLEMKYAVKATMLFSPCILMYWNYNHLQIIKPYYIRLSRFIIANFS